ncbi:MAG: glycosyltransferase family 2 protein [Gomphosphaeria aponina SAG 52.96 = DSM 107014]|uniref:Beta-monoglucosyldiacylglycerol synthase n=1 Tax=Gomphosphaeria aponina SAG 52.96 = DSM 107014 TaxID=1521640 RepID=A0A941JQ55_9CHRO|nr:glycosyltransferase family 2 protein [Gomphosphaeria aponina SAG 52.96 = DSM 107014]
MTENYWSEKETEKEIDPIRTLLSEWSDPEEEEEDFRSDFFQGLAGRRKKAAFTLMIVWGITIALHLISWGYWLAFGVTGLMAVQVMRLISVKPTSQPEILANDSITDAPTMSLLIAAKNEEAVIGQLVKMLFELDYPEDKYEVWVIDDNSTDKTPEILEKLGEEYKELKVLQRPAGAGGGKSGALNQVLPLTKGAIVAVFDADAKVPKDLLRQVAPMFEQAAMGAVQVRKAIANQSMNFWTRSQMAEMTLDSYSQQQRIALGGIGELRGNGQFVRRSALDSCGGWNEQTITDDLDLTIRLHLDQWEIGFLLSPAVEEEGVTSVVSLWHQRNRWAEGGYQRYLDYWRFLISARLSWRKKLDLFSFFLLQYLLPTATVPDLFMAIARHRFPLLSPLSGLFFFLSFWGMLTGLRRIQANQKLGFSDFFTIGIQTFRGMIYLLHWLLVIPATTARISVRPKRLKWVKTVHQGHS